MTLGIQPGAVVVPSQAVQSGQSGSYVFVVKKDLTAEMRMVEAGRATNGELVIEKGIQPGETVVTDGQLQLSTGTTVEIKNTEKTESQVHEYRRAVHPPAGHDHAGHAGISYLRGFRLPGASGERSAQCGFSTVLVSATLPGASPETMASSVATPLEREFSTIAGLDSMNSVNALGITQITLQFNLKRNIDAAAQDVQAAISRAAKQLPAICPAAGIPESKSS